MSDKARIEKFPNLTTDEQSRLYQKAILEIRKYREGLKLIRDFNRSNPGPIAKWAVKATNSLLEGENIDV